MMTIDDILSFINPPRFNRKSLFSAWQVELTTRCPLRCKMCIRDGVDDWHGADMDLHNFKSLAPYFKDTESVVLSGWGEPLLYKNLFEAVRLVKECGARAGFVTSGKGLSREYISELIDARTDFIGFSLAGTKPETHNHIRVNSDLKVLLEDIQTFTETKNKRKINKPDLHIVYLMLKDNIAEVPSLIRLAKDIGIGTILLTNIIHVTNEWQDRQKVFGCDESLNPFEEILTEAGAKAKELKVNLRLPSLSPRRVPVCEEDPLQNLYISVDGEVSPCVYLYPPASSSFKRIFCESEHTMEKLSFGNIFKEPFHTIWNNQEYIEFRDCLVSNFPVPPAQCKTCHKMLGL